MSTPSLPSFTAVSETLAANDITIHPSYLHGIWCGLITGGQYCDPQDWLALATEEENTWADLGTQAQILLLQLAEQTVLMISELDFGFQPLLPDDETSLQVRAFALNEWCFGFVNGLQNQRDQQNLLTGDGAQALADLTKISEMDFDTIECDEEESSYIELVEFVRVAVMLIHQNLLEDAQSGAIVLPAHFH